MKAPLFLYVFFFIISCSYPDIDSVPDFKSLKLTKEELFDLCQLSSDDKSEIDKCIKKEELFNLCQLSLVDKNEIDKCIKEKQ